MTRAICVLIVGFQFQGLDKVEPRNARNFTNDKFVENGAARLAELAEFLQTHSQASLPMGFQKLHSIRFANDPVFSAAILLSALGVL